MAVNLIWTHTVPSYTINLCMQRLPEINKWRSRSTLVSIESPLIVLCYDGYVPIQKMPPQADMTTFVAWSSSVNY